MSFRARPAPPTGSRGRQRGHRIGGPGNPGIPHQTVKPSTAAAPASATASAHESPPSKRRRAILFHPLGPHHRQARTAGPDRGAVFRTGSGPSGGAHRHLGRAGRGRVPRPDPRR